MLPPGEVRTADVQPGSMGNKSFVLLLGNP